MQHKRVLHGQGIAPENEREKGKNIASSKPSDYRYALGKFTKAVNTLATHPSVITDRLYPASLDFAVIQKEDLPQELHQDFAWVKHELTKRPDVFPSQGAVLSTLFRMRKRTGSKIAERIVHIERELRLICEGVERNDCRIGEKPGNSPTY